jgi:hypothetical protein
MAFEVYGVDQKESGSEKKVDFEKLNEYVVSTAQLENRETLVGVVSMIVDIGTQEQPDAEVTFVGDEEDEKKAIAEKPQTYFKDGFDPETKKPVRLKCWAQKPIQSVAVAVDFPDIIVDKGQFFGESKPLPLRLWLGGQFYIPDVGMVIGRPTPLKVNKKLGDWSLDQKHLFYKMAVASKLIKPGEVFKPQQIDQLLGKAYQFEAQVFFKENKGKKYYTEYIKFVSGLGRGQVEPELVVQPMMIQFNKENDPSAIKDLRNHVVNTLKRAVNYQGSAIQKQIEAVRGTKEDSSQEGVQEQALVKVTVKEEKNEQPSFDPPEDDTLPF